MIAKHISETYSIMQLPYLTTSSF